MPNISVLDRANAARSARAKGDTGEEKACAWLESRGFRILARNYSTRFGEIDIIALRENVLHFIEVKSFSPRTLSPRYAISAKKLQKIYASIDVLLSREIPQPTAKQGQKHNPRCNSKHNLAPEDLAGENLAGFDYCVDALLLWGEHIELLENISIESSRSFGA